jgi:hypothetical protein
MRTPVVKVEPKPLPVKKESQAAGAPEPQEKKGVFREVCG